MRSKVCRSVCTLTSLIALYWLVWLPIEHHVGNNDYQNHRLLCLGVVRWRDTFWLFGCNRFWVLELNVLIRERSGLLPFPCTTLRFTVKIKILQAYTSNFHTTQTTTVQQTNEYFVFKGWQCWSNRQTSSLLSTVGVLSCFIEGKCRYS
jgi:hypothetical protein